MQQSGQPSQMRQCELTTILKRSFTLVNSLRLPVGNMPAVIVMELVTQAKLLGYST